MNREKVNVYVNTALTDRGKRKSAEELVERIMSSSFGFELDEDEPISVFSGFKFSNIPIEPVMHYLGEYRGVVPFRLESVDDGWSWQSGEFRYPFTGGHSDLIDVVFPYRDDDNKDYFETLNLLLDLICNHNHSIPDIQTTFVEDITHYRIENIAKYPTLSFLKEFGGEIFYGYRAFRIR